MIKYQLICDKLHEFEGWFQTSAAFEEQSRSKLIRCPVCDSGNVRRALMTPSLSSPKRRRANNVTLHDQSLAHQGDVPSDFASTGRDMSTVPDERSTAGVGEALAELRKIQRKIQSECRNVGTNFAEEARKIHYGESEPENIYGQSTRKEAESLAEEGIDVVSMLWLPPEH